MPGHLRLRGLHVGYLRRLVRLFLLDDPFLLWSLVPLDGWCLELIQAQRNLTILSYQDRVLLGDVGPDHVLPQMLLLHLLRLLVVLQLVLEEVHLRASLSVVLLQQQRDWNRGVRAFLLNLFGLLPRTHVVRGSSATLLREFRDDRLLRLHGFNGLLLGHLRELNHSKDDWIP
jgi:hypothetical protein